jgi:hypothetical protein
VKLLPKQLTRPVEHVALLLCGEPSRSRHLSRGAAVDVPQDHDLASPIGQCRQSGPERLRLDILASRPGARELLPVIGIRVTVSLEAIWHRRSVRAGTTGSTTRSGCQASGPGRRCSRPFAKPRSSSEDLAGLAWRRTDPPLAGRERDVSRDPNPVEGQHDADAAASSRHWPRAYRVPSLSSKSAHQPKC